MVGASGRNSRRDQSSALCLTSWAECPPLCTASPRRLLKWPSGVGLSITSFVSGFCEETTGNENTSNSLLKSRNHFSRQRASSSTSHWENQLQVMKKSPEFFHLQRTHLKKTCLPPAATLLVLQNPIWGIWGNSAPVPPFVLSQLQRMSCFGGGNHPWAHYFLSFALQSFLL